MSHEYSEDNLVEAATQQGLEDLGWQVRYAWKKETFGQDGLLGRENKSEVILKRYLLQALTKLNPNLPHVAYQHAVDQITEKAADKKLVQINKEKYTLFTHGTDVSFTNDKGALVKKKLKVFDFDHPTEKMSGMVTLRTDCNIPVITNGYISVSHKIWYEANQLFLPGI